MNLKLHADNTSIMTIHQSLHIGDESPTSMQNEIYRNLACKKSRLKFVGSWPTDKLLNKERSLRQRKDPTEHQRNADNYN